MTGSTTIPFRVLLVPRPPVTSVHDPVPPVVLRKIPPPSRAKRRKKTVPGCPGSTLTPVKNGRCRFRSPRSRPRCRRRRASATCPSAWQVPGPAGARVDSGALDLLVVERGNALPGGTAVGGAEGPASRAAGDGARQPGIADDRRPGQVSALLIARGPGVDPGLGGRAERAEPATETRAATRRARTARTYSSRSTTGRPRASSTRRSPPGACSRRAGGRCAGRDGEPKDR